METGSVDEPMYRKTSLRMTEALHEAIEAEAARQEISAAQFLRDAALKEIAYEAGRRGDEEDVRRVIRRLVEAEREERGDG